MIIRGNRLVARVRWILTLVIILGMVPFMSACRHSAEANAEGADMKAKYLPKYLAFYELQTRLLELPETKQNLTKIYFPPLSIHPETQVTERYHTMENHLGMVRFSSNFSREHGFNGYITEREEKTAGQLIAKMPRDLNRGLFFKYYFKEVSLPQKSQYDVRSLKLSASIEGFNASNAQRPIQMLWYGTIFLTVHSEIAFEQALNLGFKKLAGYYDRTSTEKGAFNLLDI